MSWGWLIATVIVWVLSAACIISTMYEIGAGKSNLRKGDFWGKAKKICPSGVSMTVNFSPLVNSAIGAIRANRFSLCLRAPGEFGHRFRFIPDTHSD